MKRMEPLDTINKAHETQERLLAIGDLLSEVDGTLSDNTISTVGNLLMEYAATMKACLDTLWDGGAK